MAYNCRVNNFLGVDTFNTTVLRPSASLSYSSGFRFNYNKSSGFAYEIGQAHLNEDIFNDILTAAGYDNVSNVTVFLPSDVLTTALFEDGTERTGGSISLTDIDSPLVDYYVNPIERIAINFRGTFGDETIVTAKNHGINFSNPSNNVWRNLQDVADWWKNAGFVPRIPNNFNPPVSSSITCELIDGGSSTTTVIVDYDSQETNIITHIVNNDSDDLQTQINFINNNVVSALNNNVQRAQEVASQANDGVVGLTFQLRDLMSRIEALENQ